MSSRLQRSSVSFRRQGSSGRTWNDPMRGLDLKGLSTPRAAPGAVAPLHADAGMVLAGDPSPRAVSRSLVRHGGCGGGGGGVFGGAASSSSAGGAVVESPDAGAPASPGTVVIGAGGERHERPARRRRRISSAFCACMGHPPASHAQQ